MNADLNRISELVIGCAYSVNSTLGSGFLESVYEGAMSLEMADRGLQFERQKRLPVTYRNEVVGEFVADFVIEQCLILELKAVRALGPEHQAQLLNYLNASRLSIGLLINFGTTRVQVKRLVNQLREY